MLCIDQDSSSDGNINAITILVWEHWYGSQMALETVEGKKSRLHPSG